MSASDMEIAEGLIQRAIDTEGLPRDVYEYLERAKGLVHTNRMTLEDVMEQLAIIEQLGYQDNG